MLSTITLPADNHKLDLCGASSNPPPDVHGEDGAAAVEYRGKGGDEGGHHHSQHQATETVRHEAQDQGGEGDVGTAVLVTDLLAHGRVGARHVV